MSKAADTRYQAGRVGTSGTEIKIHRASKPAFDDLGLEELILA